MEITFNGVRLTEIFRVKDVKRSILPPRQNYSLDVPAKHGQYYLGYKYSPKVIDVEIVMISSNMLSNLRTLAWMLDIAEPSKLEFSDEPDKHYYAVVDSSTDIDQILHVGTGTISFVCFNPLAFSNLEKNYTADETGKLVINNGGTAPTAPKFEIDFTSECGFVSLVSPRGVIQIGQSNEVDVVPAQDSERLINDDMSSLATVTLNTNGKVRTAGATIQGTIKTNTLNIRPDSYGTPTAGWHGMTIRKELTTTADYWETSMIFRLASDSYFGVSPAEKQIGKIEFNIMDETNNFIAGFTMADTLEAYTFNVPQFYVGDTLIWEDKPSIPAPSTVKQYNTETGKYEYKTVQATNIGKWNHFWGKVIIRKERDKFYFELQTLEGDTQNEIISRTSKTYYDSTGAFNGKRAKALNVWFGKYADRPPVSLNYVDHLTFRKDYVDEYINIPNTFGTGDKLIIDCNTSSVYLNGTLWMDKVDVGSKFFELVEGQSEVFLMDNSISTRPIVNAKIIEKYL